MPRITKLNPKLMQQVDLEDALEEFLLVKRADGAAQRTRDDYCFHVDAFFKASPNLTGYEALAQGYFRPTQQQE
ncbi:MAG: hypothetical protein ACPL5F_07265 [Moorellaceae bacterium]